MANSKVKVHEWSINPYPRKLWVVKTKDSEVIRNMFLDKEESELSPNPPNLGNLNAFVMSVILKETMEFGYLVCLRQQIDVRTASHESFHVAEYLCNEIDVEMFPNQINEHIAYLIGWIADKIWQVNTNKIKD